MRSRGAAHFSSTRCMCVWLRVSHSRTHWVPQAVRATLPHRMPTRPCNSPIRFHVYSTYAFASCHSLVCDPLFHHHPNPFTTTMITDSSSFSDLSNDRFVRLPPSPSVRSITGVSRPSSSSSSSSYYFGPSRVLSDSPGAIAVEGASPNHVDTPRPAPTGRGLVARACGWVPLVCRWIAKERYPLVGWLVLSLIVAPLMGLWAIPGITSSREVACNLVVCGNSDYCGADITCHNGLVHFMGDPDTVTHPVQYEGLWCPLSMPSPQICYYDTRFSSTMVSLTPSRRALYIWVGIVAPVFVWVLCTLCMIGSMISPR